MCRRRACLYRFKEFFELSRRVHVRQPILPTLFGRLDCDRLPSQFFLHGLLPVKIDNRAFGNNRRDFRSANLDGFLHDQFHVLPLRNRLPKRNVATKQRRAALVQFAETNLPGVKIDNLRRDFASPSVEDNGLISACHPQHVATMMRFRAA